VSRGGEVQQTVLSFLKPDDGSLSAWQWQLDAEQATYQALYPRAWTRYHLEHLKLTLICRQVSPVIPHEYKESCLPCAVFVWSIENHDSQPADVSIVFTFASGQGGQADSNVNTQCFTKKNAAADSTISGVTIKQQFDGMLCTYGIAAKGVSGHCNVTCREYFDGSGTGKELWQDVLDDGALNELPSDNTQREGLASVAVCAQCSLPANSAAECEFSLVWDMPIIKFGSRMVSYRRRYTRWFGDDANAAPELSCHALNNYREWEKSIHEWQHPILNNESLPSWYKSALFNELYFISDGGTIWLEHEIGENSAHVREYGRFAYLEGHEYRMYNTYDVHHNASFALIKLWPQLQLSLQYDIADTVLREDDRAVRYMNGEVLEMKAGMCVPHDMGDPADEPYININAYMIHPTQEWKDLNIKFVLQVYRDYVVTQDVHFLRYVYNAAQCVIQSSLRWDKDGDGLIENANFPDQTYDAWTMSGPSAYCAGMWLAALCCMQHIARVLNKRKDYELYKEMLHTGRRSFEDKLWHGSYYKFDCSASKHHDSIMSDQLAGQWYLKASAIPDGEVFPRQHVHTALNTIFKLNVMTFESGTLGAVNGMRPDGTKDVTSVQSEEFWTGVTYALAATMIQEAGSVGYTDSDIESDFYAGSDSESDCSSADQHTGDGKPDAAISADVITAGNSSIEAETINTDVIDGLETISQDNSGDDARTSVCENAKTKSDTDNNTSTSNIQCVSNNEDTSSGTRSAAGTADCSDSSVSDVKDVSDIDNTVNLATGHTQTDDVISTGVDGVDDYVSNVLDAGDNTDDNAGTDAADNTNDNAGTDAGDNTGDGGCDNANISEDALSAMLEQGWQTGYGAYNVNYLRYGLQFQVPEAMPSEGIYRSLGYMRPLCIWSMQHALERYHPHLLHK